MKIKPDPGSKKRQAEKSVADLFRLEYPNDVSSKKPRQSVSSDSAATNAATKATADTTPDVARQLLSSMSAAAEDDVLAVLLQSPQFQSPRFKGKLKENL